MEERELELPEPAVMCDCGGNYYTADQVRQAVLAERESLLLRVDNVMTGAGIGKADRDYILERLKSPAR